MNNVNNGIVISCRARLARNFDGYVFPARLDDEGGKAILKKTEDALARSGESFGTVKRADMSDLQAETLKELHLISDELLRGNKNAAVVVNKNNEICIMVNEEDHLREQCILSGNRLSEAYSRISAIDDIIASQNKFAFDKRLGYLTACPTNVGTGLRASALMFNAVSRFDMTVRGEYGEGSDSEGFLYQISNQKTLGISEDEIISSVSGAVNQIEKQEIVARNALLQSNEALLRDNIMRSYGILTNAYKLSFKEFTEKFAMVKLGVYYGFINCNDNAALGKMLDKFRPANMMTSAGKIMNENERDIYRAANVAAELKKITV